MNEENQDYSKRVSGNALKNILYRILYSSSRNGLDTSLNEISEDNREELVVERPWKFDFVSIFEPEKKPTRK